MAITGSYPHRSHRHARKKWQMVVLFTLARLQGGLVVVVMVGGGFVLTVKMKKKENLNKAVSFSRVS